MSEARFIILRRLNPEALPAALTGAPLDASLSGGAEVLLALTFDVVFEKRCDTCRESMALTELRTHRGSHDGHRTTCAECLLNGRYTPYIEPPEYRARRNHHPQQVHLRGGVRPMRKVAARARMSKRRKRAKGVALPKPSFATILRQVWELYRLSLGDDIAAGRRLMERHPEAAKVAMLEAEKLAAIFGEVGAGACSECPLSRGGEA